MKLKVLLTWGLLLSVTSSTLLAQSSFCFKGATISLRGGETSLVLQDSLLGDSRIIRFSVRPLVTRYGYIVTDEQNQILKIGLSNLIDFADLEVGKYRVWAFSHVGRITAQPGQIASEVSLASFCDELTSNFVSVEIAGDPGLFTLQVLHHNDPESALINAGENFPDIGGVHRFKSVLDELRSQSATENVPNLLFSAGDNFLAGPIFTAGQRQGAFNPSFDVIAQLEFDYDAIGIGNHEFDFGPNQLAKYIRDFGEEAPAFLSANLDFSQEPDLLPFVEEGTLAKSTILEKGEEQIGIIGLTTPNLSFISAPRRTIVMDNLAEIVNAEVTKLEAQGVNKIILISHLQGIDNDIELIGSLSGVDLVIAGGGDEFLSNNPEADAIPGLVEAEEVRGTYPIEVKDQNDQTVYVVATPGGYTYLGNLKISFSESGEIVDVDPDSGPVKVQSEMPDAFLQEAVIEPVNAFLEELANNIVARTEIELNGRRGDVRTEETNAGNLIADAILFSANLFAPVFGIEEATIAIQNGGGIRNSVVVPAGGDITELTTFNMLPFPNFVSIVDAVTPSQFKQMMERAVSDVENVQGQFAQIAGFRFKYNPEGTPQQVDSDGNITAAGNRVVEITLNDGQKVVENGVVNESAPTLRLATIDFLARGGDAYPLSGNDFTSIGTTYQQALVTYLVGVLGGGVSGFIYPEGGEGRIQTASGPNLLALPNFGNQDTEAFHRFSAAPNPFKDYLDVTINSPSELNTNIQLTDLNGRLIQQLYVGSLPAGIQRFNFNIDQGSVERGIYLLSLTQGDEQKTIKVIKY